MEAETYSFKVGSFSCAAIRDGGGRYPLAVLLTNLPTNIYEPWLRARGEDIATADLPFTCLFVDTGRERVLIDTGIGAESAGPTPGRLLDLLKSIGVGPEQIDIVILSHAHPDHVGGILMADGRAAFPRARYVMSQREWDFWSSSTEVAEQRMDESLKASMLGAVRKYVFPLRERLEFLKGEAEIVAGVKAIEAFGHSPGHMAIEINSEGEKLLFVADAMLHPLNLQYPDSRSAMDHIPTEMVATRLRLFEKAAKEKCLVSTAHFAFPGLGRVLQKGDRWEWQPIATKR